MSPEPTEAERAVVDVLSGDSECSWHVGCDVEDCYGPRAAAIVAKLRPILAAEAREEIAEEFDRRYEEFVAKQSWEAARSAGYAARLTRTLRTSAEQSALRTTTPEKEN